VGSTTKITTTTHGRRNQSMVGAALFKPDAKTRQAGCM
jgi:hypothetical protein